MKTIHVQAKQPTKIITRFSNSIPTTYRFTVTNVSSKELPTGTIEVRGSNWIFPKPPLTKPLQAENAVTKSMWDVFFSVHVTSDHDVNITMEGDMHRPMVLFALAVGIMGVAASLLILGLMR